MESKLKFGLKLTALVVGLAPLFATSVVHAADVSGAKTGESGMTLNIEPAHRKFMRFSYIYIKPNTKTSPTKDITGALLSRQDVAALASCTAGASGTCATQYGVTGTAATNAKFIFAAGLGAAMDLEVDPSSPNGVANQSVGIGLPNGISAEAKGAGSLAISAGAFLDAEEKWSTELYVFALPFNNLVEGGGSVTEIDNNDGSVIRVRSNYITGKSIIKTKQLPPTAVFSYYFGDRKSAFRPFLGLGVTYAMFFNTQATETLELYSGGPTEVKLKNAFGAGPFAGLQYRLTDKLHLSAQLGYVKLKTTATMTTRTTAAGLVNSPVLLDFSGYVGATNRGLLDPASPDYNPQAVLDGLTAIQNRRGGSLGTYVRKQDTKLDPYIMTLSIGYDF